MLFPSLHFHPLLGRLTINIALLEKKRRAERVRERVFVRAETCVLFYDPECDRFAVNHCGSFVATRKGRWGGDGRGAVPLMDCGGENDLLDAPKARDKYRYDSMGIRGKRSDRVVCPKNPAYSREDIRSRSAHLNKERGSRAARITPVGFRRPARAVVHFRFFRPATRQQQQRSLFDKSAKPTGDSALSLSFSGVIRCGQDGWPALSRPLSTRFVKSFHH